MRRYFAAGVSSLRVAALITGADVAVALGVMQVLRTSLSGSFGLLLLLEGAGLMLLGGALSISGQEGIRKLTSAVAKVELKWTDPEREAHEMRAARYVLAGVLLFAESAALAFLIA